MQRDVYIKITCWFLIAIMSTGTFTLIATAMSTYDKAGYSNFELPQSPRRILNHLPDLPENSVCSGVIMVWKENGILYWCYVSDEQMEMLAQGLLTEEDIKTASVKNKKI